MLVRGGFALARFGVVGVVGVEGCELFLEPADALVLLLVATKGANERRVVVRSEALTDNLPCAGTANGEPENQAKNGQQQDDDQPHRLGETANSVVRHHGTVDHRIDRRNNDYDRENEEPTHTPHRSRRIWEIPRQERTRATGSPPSSQTDPHTLDDVNRIPPVVTYTVLRLLTFAVPLAILLLLNFEPWVATVLAAIIGLSLSYIFLRQPREKIAAELYDRRHGNRTPDSSDEDAEDGLSSPNQK